MNKLYFIAFFIGIIACTSRAQEDIRIGAWNSYAPLINNYISVAQSDETVYFATPQGIVMLDKADNSLGFITRVSGLNDVNICKLSYNKATKTLLVCYNNGNLDLVSAEGVVSNISDVRRAQVSGSRRVSHIFNIGNEAYLSYPFGLVRLGIPSKEVVGTTFTNEIKTQASLVLHDTIWLATSNGVYWIEPTANVLDFSRWSRLPIRPLYRSKQLVAFKNQLVVDVNDSLFVRRGATWQFLHTRNDIADYRSLEATSNYLVAMSSINSDPRCNLDYIDETGAITTPLLGQRVGDCGQVIADEKNTWIADRWYGIGWHNRASNTDGGVAPSSPIDKTCRQTAISPVDRSLWSASGSVTDNWTYAINASGFYHYKEGTWTNYNIGTMPTIFKDSLAIRDILTVAIRPSDGHVFMGSYASENLPFLVECDAAGKVIKLYNRFSQTSIGIVPADATSRRISSMAFDKDNNLWLCNYGAVRPLSVFRANGTWQSFTLPIDNLQQIIIDKNGYKWIASEGINGGVVVFDEGDATKLGDEKTILLTSANTSLKTNTITSIAVDLEGDVWVGTNEGAYVFQCTSSIFDIKNSCKGSQPVVEQDGIGEGLLRQNTVTAIGVDGANHKWFGTANGIFVQSSDGRTALARFDVTNSPLPSNNIQYFTFDEKTGIVWISTTEGLVSYRTTATTAEKIVTEKPLVFPNPIRPDYDGLIAIRGLARDANVKITDVSGALFYETTANGGQAVWDGRDYNGKRAASGVYLVYTTNSEGAQSVVTKLLILN